MTKTSKLLSITLLVSLAAPFAAGHASPTPLDNETHILADEASDNFAYYDGFDIQDLFIREGFLRDTQETGIILRPIIYGGFAPVPVASTMNLDISFEVNGTAHTMRASSTDGEKWDGDFRVVESSMEAADDGFGVQGSIQLFVSYAELGAKIGDSIESFTMVSLADEDPRDISPGGYFAPGSGGEVELPGDGRALETSYILTGPKGYTDTVVVKNNQNYTFEVTNLITVIGQHIALELPDSPGWTFERIDANPVALDPGVHTKFKILATSDATAQPATVAVTTDTGGREEFTLQPAAAGVETPEEEEKKLEEESPAPLLILPVAVALYLARRRQ